MTPTQPRGRPFPKGVSPNPGGRPKGVEEVRTLARGLTAQVFAELERIAFSSPDDRARLSAIQVILDRAWGKAPQAAEGDSGAPIHVQIVRFSDLEPLDGEAEAA